MAATKKGKWDEENMKKAVDGMLAGKFTLREAADRFSVPRSTLSDRVCAIKKGKSIKITPSMGGFKQTFDNELEGELVSHLKYLDSCFLPVNKTELLKLVYDLAEYFKLPHQFNTTKKTAGNKFYRGFIKRHPEFSLRCAQSTSLQRAQGFNKEQVDSFFDKLEELMNKYSFPPTKIFNCDETGVSVVHSNSQKVLSMKGKKQVSKLTSGERGRNITVMLCINASGDQFIPPLFVFPRIRMDPQLTKDAPDGSIFDAQESGWISVSGFVKWLKAFIERVNPTAENPVLLILDGHSTHKDLQAILLAKKHHVHMLSLPPHTTHKLQPLDRAVMRPFKSAFNAACEAWMSKYGKLGLKIIDRDICGLVGTAFTKICRMELAKSGFQCTGIYPLNRNIFSDLDFLPATNTRKEAEGDGPEKPPAKTRPTNPNVNSLPQSPPTVPKTPVIDMAVPSTSRSRPTDFNKAIAEISPVADDLQRKIFNRKRRGEKSEILTSTPFKNILEEKEEIKRQKKEKELCGKNDPKKKATSGGRPIKRKLQFGNGSEDNNRPKENNTEETECIICGECFEEDWVQCCNCRGWAHVGCADSDEIAYFVCEHCKK